MGVYSTESAWGEFFSWKSGKNKECWEIIAFLGKTSKKKKDVFVHLLRGGGGFKVPLSYKMIIISKKKMNWEIMGKDHFTDKYYVL